MRSTNTNLALVSPSSLLSIPIKTATCLRAGLLKKQLTGLASQPTRSPVNLLVSPGSRQSPYWSRQGLASHPTGLARVSPVILTGLDNQLYYLESKYVTKPMTFEKTVHSLQSDT